MRSGLGIALVTSIPVAVFSLIGAQAGEVKLLSALVMKPALVEIAGEFERSSGHKLIIDYGSAGAVRNRIQSGESADVAIIQKQAIETLITEGKIRAGSNLIVARSGVGVAVPRGAPKPDISSVDALKRSLLAANSIAYPVPDAGHASGIHFLGVIERLGIAKAVNDKAKFMDGSVAEFAAQNTADMIISQPMEILATPGYVLVGWLPSELQDFEKFTWAVGITTVAKEPEAANALVRFLASPAAAAVIRARGMEPGAN